MVDLPEYEPANVSLADMLHAASPKSEDESGSSDPLARGFYLTNKQTEFRPHFTDLEKMHDALSAHIDNYAEQVKGKAGYENSPKLLRDVLNNGFIHLGHAYFAHTEKAYTRGSAPTAHYLQPNMDAYKAAEAISPKIPGEFVSADTPMSGHPNGPKTSYDHMKLAAAAFGQVANLLGAYSSAAKVKAPFENYFKTKRGAGKFGQVANSIADNYAVKLSKNPTFAEDYTGPRETYKTPTEEGYSSPEDKMQAGAYISDKVRREHEFRMANDPDYASHFADRKADREAKLAELTANRAAMTRQLAITGEHINAKLLENSMFKARHSTWQDRTEAYAPGVAAHNEAQQQIEPVFNHIDTLSNLNTSLRAVADSIPKYDRKRQLVPTNYAGSLGEKVKTKDTALNSHLNKAAQSITKLTQLKRDGAPTAAIALHAHEAAEHLTNAATHMGDSGIADFLSKNGLASADMLTHVAHIAAGGAHDTANALDAYMHGRDSEGNLKPFPGVSGVTPPSMVGVLGEKGAERHGLTYWSIEGDFPKQYRTQVSQAASQTQAAPKGVKFQRLPYVPEMPVEPGPEPKREEFVVKPNTEQFHIGRGGAPFDVNGTLPHGVTRGQVDALKIARHQAAYGDAHAAAMDAWDKENAFDAPKTQQMLRRMFPKMDSAVPEEAQQASNEAAKWHAGRRQAFSSSLVGPGQFLEDRGMQEPVERLRTAADAPARISELPPVGTVPGGQRTKWNAFVSAMSNR